MVRKTLSLFIVGLLFLGCARNLADQLLSADEGTRQAALKKLDGTDVGVRRDVLPYLIERLSSENGNVRRRAVQALTRLGLDAVNALVRTLAGGNPKARAAAAETLGHLGADARSAMGPLVEAERDDDAEVRIWAAVSLARIKAFMSPTELQFFRVLYGKKEFVSPGALKSADFTPDDPRSLIRGLRNSDARGRADAVLSLVEKGPLAVPALLGGLTDPDEGVRDGAAEAFRLVTLDPGDVDEALVSYLKEGDAASRAACGKVFKGPALSAEALTGLVSSGSLCVRMEAARSLGALGPGAKAAAPVLEAAADDPNPLVRQAALRALRKVLRPAPSEAQKALAKELDALWSDMTDRLSHREVEAALEHFAGPRRDAYRAAFLALGESLPAVAKGLDGDLSFGGAFGDRFVTIEGRVFIEGVQQALEVQFVRDDKGEWKIRSF